MPFSTFISVALCALSIFSSPTYAQRTGRTYDVTKVEGATYGYEASWTIRNKDSQDAQLGQMSQYYIEDLDASHNQGSGIWTLKPIEINAGDRLRIKVKNELAKEDITLHFHGIKQSNWYVYGDGPQAVTQSGIYPGATFTYDILCPEAGTHWIHSHAPGQYPKGIRVPLIVRSAADLTKYPYDLGDDKIISVSDWWPDFTKVEEHYTAKQEYPFSEKNSLCGPGIEPYPHRAIMNDRVFENNGLSGGVGSVTVAMPAAADKPVRLRFVNMSAFARFHVFVQDHVMQVIEVDGVSVTPDDGRTTNGIELSSGQRVSVLIKSKGTVAGAKKRFALVAAIDPHLSSGSSAGTQEAECTWKAGATAGSDRAKVQYVAATLDYPGAGTNTDSLADANTFIRNTKYLTRLDSKDQDELFNQRLSVDWKSFRGSQITRNIPHYPFDFYESRLRPDAGPAAYTDVDEKNIHFLDLVDNPPRPKQQWGSVNRHMFKSPELGNRRGTVPRGMPALLRIADAGTDASKLAEPATYGDAEQTIVMNAGETHWFVIRGSLGDHPWHVHGHVFQVLTHRWTERLWWAPEAERPAKIKQEIQALWPAGSPRPYTRDTLMVEKYTVSVIAVKADNPGVWFMHCHNDFHARTGMAMQLVEAPGAVRDEMGTFAWTDAVGSTPAGVTFTPGAATAGPAFEMYKNGVRLFIDYWRRSPTRARRWTA